MDDAWNSVWRSLGRFAVKSAAPLPVARSIFGWVSLALVIGGAVGGFFQPWIWLAVLGLVSLLSTVAGVRLQLEKDARERPAFSVGVTYHRDRGPMKVGGRFKESTTFWAVVKNLGPPAEFVARAHTFKGIGANPYRVDELAWEYGGNEPRHRIERGNQARVRVAEAQRYGTQDDFVLQLRFFIPRAGMWATSAPAKPGVHGMGKVLTPAERVSFSLDVMNVGVGSELGQRVLLLFDGDGTVGDFRVDP